MRDNPLDFHSQLPRVLHSDGIADGPRLRADIEREIGVLQLLEKQPRVGKTDPGEVFADQRQLLQRRFGYGRPGNKKQIVYWK